MNKECFVGLIQSIKNQFEREDKFCDSLYSACKDAGECMDFRDKYAFTPITEKFKDEICESIAKCFGEKNYEGMLDLINWFIYECEFGESKIGSKDRFNLVVEIDGTDTTFTCDSIDSFYEAIVKIYSKDGNGAEILTTI